MIVDVLFVRARMTAGALRDIFSSFIALTGSQTSVVLFRYRRISHRMRPRQQSALYAS